MGWFDGPRAYRTVCERIFGGERTKEDKNYYKMAEHLQTQHRLPDGAWVILAYDRPTWH